VDKFITESEEVMAIRKKPTSKKQEVKVEAPKQEVIEPKKSVETPSPEPPAKQKESAKKSDAKPVKVEEKPQKKKSVTLKEAKQAAIAEAASTPIVEVKPAPAPEPIIKEAPAKVAVVAAPVQEEAVSLEVTVGSTVMMPSGQIGVVANKHKNKFTVSSITKPGRSYMYESSKLSLVK
jgi:hypothetical protein